MANYTAHTIDLETLDTLSTVSKVVEAMLIGRWAITDQTLESCASMIWRRALVHRADEFARRTA